MKAGIKQLARYEQGARENEKLKDIVEWVNFVAVCSKYTSFGEFTTEN